MDELDLQVLSAWSENMYDFVKVIMDHMKSPQDYGTGVILNMVATIPANCITVPTATLGADIAVRPFELVQVLLAGFLSGKPLDKLTETQSFLLGHFWHLPFGASIHLLVAIVG